MLQVICICSSTHVCCPKASSIDVNQCHYQCDKRSYKMYCYGHRRMDALCRSQMSSQSRRTTTSALSKPAGVLSLHRKLERATLTPQLLWSMSRHSAQSKVGAEEAAVAPRECLDRVG